LDVSAVDSIHNLIIDQRDKGSAILLISEDLDELFKLSDRLIVMYEGKVITEIETELATVENIGLAMAGINE
jgi:simple sugar transport system ATP-binding protein